MSAQTTKERTGDATTNSRPASLSVVSLGTGGAGAGRGRGR